jgi:hypothetical protein
MKKFGEMQKLVNGFKSGSGAMKQQSSIGKKLTQQSSIKAKPNKFSQLSSIGGIMGTGLKKRRKKP